MKIIFLGTSQFVQPIRNQLTQHFTLTESLTGSDLAVVASYGRILTKDELNTPKFGSINVHPSLLPKYRGPSPIQQAILNGDKITGITIIKIDEEVDHGPILWQEKMELSSSDNFDILSNKMFQRASEILPKIIEDFTAGKLTAKSQNHSLATYCDKLTRESGFFDINTPPSPQTLNRMIRAYYPWPSVWTLLRLKSFGGQAKLRIVKFLPEKKVQVEGGRPMSYKDFVNGYPEAKTWLQRLFSLA